MNAKQLKLILALVTSIFSLNAKAQMTATALDNLYPGYQPSVLSSYDEVNKVFDGMPLGFRMGGSLGLGRSSECYQRAELWTYNFYLNQNIKAMKVFVFFTHAYRQAFYEMHRLPYNWWFHVAPYLISRNAKTQKLEEWVLDPTFFDAPQDMKNWSDEFVDTKHKCAEFVPYAQFRNEVEPGPNAVFGKEHCYLIRVPAMDYEPTDVEMRELGKKPGYTWDIDQLEQAVTYAPTAKSHEWWNSLLKL